MSNIVPVSWRDSVDELRGRVAKVFDRWRPGRERRVAVRSDEHWPDNLLFGAAPMINLEESDDEITVTAEMPGLDEKDFHVELDDSRLIVHGEKRMSRKEKKRNYYYTESSYGSFYRTIPLPCAVKADKVDAAYKRGVLTVRLPKTDEAKSQQIRVKIS